MTAGCEMRGLSGLVQALSALERERVLSAAAAGMQAGLDAIAGEAQALCPRDTGTLAGSIGTRVHGTQQALCGEVFAAAPYAVYVEMGTSVQPARPFLYPAMMAQRQAAVQAVVEAVCDLLERGE